MTIIEMIKNNIEPESIKTVAENERLSTGFVVNGLIAGTIVIPKNVKHSVRQIAGIGKGLKTKVNANIGTSPDRASLKEELRKLETCVRAGADAVMDLSTGGDLRRIRKAIIEASPIPLGTVPIYQVASETLKKGKKVSAIDPEHLFYIIEEQASEGVDFMTVHCGITIKTLELLNVKKRIAGIVSRGGAFLARWVHANKKENPLYEQYDRLLKIAQKYDVTLSLGDGLRPGCLADANDDGQIAELSVLGELVLRAREAQVQVMVEGPGHMPLNDIQTHIHTAKKVIYDAPYYVLGPLVTDIAPGYDHITSAIGGAVAAGAGADFLCYVTPSEHLRLPEVDDVYQGVIASRIAAHAGDIAKGVSQARAWDDALSKQRKALDWEKQKALALDPGKFQERDKAIPQEEGVCTMCGQFCAMKDEL